MMLQDNAQILENLINKIKKNARFYSLKSILVPQN